MEWLPHDTHQEFCFVYNLYNEDDAFLAHRRCDSTFLVEREQGRPLPTAGTCPTSGMQIDVEGKQTPPIVNCL